jgi:prevent-host-death family protein
MPLVGVRELKNQASRIVRAVREEGAQYVVTVDGKPAAVLRPFTEEDEAALHRARADEFMVWLDEMAERVTAAWKSPLTGVEIVAEQRREL